MGLGSTASALRRPLFEPDPLHAPRSCPGHLGFIRGAAQPDRTGNLVFVYGARVILPDHAAPGFTDQREADPLSLQDWI